MRFALLLLLVPSLAGADDDVTARPATRGTDIDDAVGKVTRADDACHPKCTTKPVQTLALAGDARLSVRTTTNSGFQGKGYVIVIENADGVWAWNGDGTFDNVWLLDNDSGMGKTADEQLEKLTIQRKDGLVWIRFRILFTLSHTYSHDVVNHHYDTLVACKLDQTPACAAVIGDRWASTTATFRKTTVSLRTDKDGGGYDRSAVELRF